MDVDVKTLLKLPLRGVARRVRTFLDRDAADRDRQTQEALAQARRELELSYGGMVEAATYMGRSLADVRLSLEQQLIRDGRTAREVTQLTKTEAEFINFADGYSGFAGQSGLWFNAPVQVRHEQGRVRLDGVNERILEIPYVFRAVASLAAGARLLDLGAAESTVALSLASLGYRVTAVDVRGYPFSHPNLTVRESLFDGWDGEAGGYDGAVVLSAIEHFGLGAYGEGSGASDADRVAMRQVRRLLRPGGRLFLTVPYGKREVTPLQRIYDDPALTELLEGFEIESREVGEKLGPCAWTLGHPTDRDCLRVALVTAKLRS